MQRLIPLLCCLLAACSGPAAGNPPGGDNLQTSVVRVIVGFDAERARPNAAELLALLGESPGSEAAFVREIPGNAAVYRLTTSLDRVELSRRLDALAGREGIRYAELDRRRAIPAPVGESK